MNIRDKKCSAAKGGVDLNRNFPYNFAQGATSHQECVSDNFHGPSPFSEPETQAYRDFLQINQHSIKFVLNFHCAGK